jgi:hypothetical protein
MQQRCLAWLRGDRRLDAVGNSARNRAARAQQRSDRSVATASDELLARLFDPPESEGFLALMPSIRSLLSDATIERLHNYSDPPEIGTPFELCAQMLTTRAVNPRRPRGHR